MNNGVRENPARLNFSMNSLAKKMRAIKRIAKDAILQDLCPKSMDVSMCIFGRILLLII